MKMYFDKFSEIGSTHKENEDFAVVGDKEHPFVIVSDGCSSSENTSTGSRILALTVAKELKKDRHLFSHNLSNDDFIEEIDTAVKKSGLIAESIGLGMESLDATLMVTIVSGGYVNVFIWGDGCVYCGLKHKNKYGVWSIEYNPEMPYYPSYKLDNSRNREYKKYAENGEIAKIDILDNHRLEVDPIEDNPSSGTWDIRDLNYILLSTDGAESFIDKENKPVGQKEINTQVNSFKRLNGEFIGRRLNRMMKENAKEGVTHYDDFTVAGIYFVDED